jgi:hypothetical protein
MEEYIAKETADGERYESIQRMGIDICRDERQKEIWGT